MMQSIGMNPRNLYSLTIMAKENENVEKYLNNNADSNEVKDVIEISQKGKLEYDVFHFLNMGGSVSGALGKRDNIAKDNRTKIPQEESNNDNAISIKPNFSNVSKSRYQQLRAEIEANFAENPSEKSKYLKVLDKVYQDYEQMQAKMYDNSPAGEEEKMEADDVIPSEENEEETIRENNDKKEIEKELEAAKERLKEETQIIKNSVSYEEKMAVIKKTLGEDENAYSDKISDVVDDFFIKTLNEKIG